MSEVDRSAVKQYWEGVTPSILGPYMMDGFGFPDSAGDFRFRKESRQILEVVGPLVYSMLRLGSPWLSYVPKVLAFSFPRLENHFFVLEASAS